MSYPDVTVLELLPSPQSRQDPVETPSSFSDSRAGGQPGRKRVGGSWENVVSRLQRRKRIVEQKRRLSACSLLVSGLGISLMIVSMELSLECSRLFVITILSVAITASTVLLLALILFYHLTDIQLLMMDEGIREWRVVLTGERKLYLTLELLLCAIHPFPLILCMQPTDTWLRNVLIVLSLLMFLRAYLIQRVTFMYSNVLNPSYQTIGSLSKVNLKFHFVLKILMNQCPGKILLLFAVLIWVMGSWMLSLCERQINNSTSNILTSMWLIPITFLTIGYGDMVPVTICGKLICLITGVTGVSCTALVIAVIVKKLELSKDEKHVYNFMQDIQLVKEVQKVAADLIGVAWLLYKHRKIRDPQKIRRYHRDVLATVCRFRRAKLRQRKLREQVNSMMDISKMQLLLYDMNAKMTESYNELEKKLGALATKVDSLAGGFEEMRSLICETLKQQRRE
ncbi:intermediate conductance calcium-activated potassium channel protein 4-like [Carcharodon carcharias]|uniref:intermediate conductance calcium-activated potassium channel protein 4-like n=1 Tax=Carcharodon carcharias TaxID=13397 RepID=UPI001B7F299A|nr:intermediate conductance calcium-activated potassium channel protein 4-like [Carcharodon carcharias]